MHLRVGGRKTRVEPMMTIREKLLHHQIHPAKLSTDIASGLISTWLMWRHQLALALVVGLVPAVLVSAAMLSVMRFEAQRDSVLGRYIARWMTSTAQAARLAGQIAMWVAAWRHSPAGVVAGLFVIAAAWAYGLMRRILARAG